MHSEDGGFGVKGLELVAILVKVQEEKAMHASGIASSPTA
jgi:hypothetical protein